MLSDAWLPDTVPNSCNNPLEALSTPNLDRLLCCWMGNLLDIGGKVD